MMMMIKVSGLRGVVCLFRQIRMQNTGDNSRWAVEGRLLTFINISFRQFDLNLFDFCNCLVMSSHCLVMSNNMFLGFLFGVIRFV